VRVLITGGAGFIGSHLVERLVRDGLRPTIVDDMSTGRSERLRQAFEHGLSPRSLIPLDVTDPRLDAVIARQRPDVIVHLAAQSKVTVSMRDPSSDLHTNVLGLVNLLDAARRHNVHRVIGASSGGTIYGSQSEQLPTTGERTPKEPLSFYGLSKHVGDRYLDLYERHFGIEYVSLALGNVYGPRQDPDGECGVVSIFVHRIARGQPCVLTGRGEAIRDYVHVTDVVEAFVRALDQGAGLINIGSGVGTSVRQLYDLIAARAGVDVPPLFGAPRPGEVSRIVLDPTRAHQQLGWSPRTALEDGVDHLLRVARSVRGGDPATAWLGSSVDYAR
jgi:UDP-glucose 4-epimerase